MIGPQTAEKKPVLVIKIRETPVENAEKPI